MSETPATRPSLLIRIGDAKDKEAWRQFVEVYAPLVYRYARGRGLQDADAADVTQEVLRAVAAAASHLGYDSRRGKFRSWLHGVARHKLSDFRARQKRQCQGSGDTTAQQLLAEQPAPEEEASHWDQEYEQQLFAWAAERVRREFKEATWRAFWRIAVEGCDADATAAELGMSLGAVYIAKSRVLARLRQQIKQVHGE
jgi:RNA polymerase sigma-70 factor (ECF subfamily)